MPSNTWIHRSASSWSISFFDDERPAFALRRNLRRPPGRLLELLVADAVAARDSKLPCEPITFAQSSPCRAQLLLVQCVRQVRGCPRAASSARPRRRCRCPRVRRAQRQRRRAPVVGVDVGRVAVGITDRRAPCRAAPCAPCPSCATPRARRTARSAARRRCRSLSALRSRCRRRQTNGVASHGDSSVIQVSPASR